MANSEDPDLTAPGFVKQSELGIKCLLGPLCPKTKQNHGYTLIKDSLNEQSVYNLTMQLNL